jgi:hypothetical protein
MFIELLLAMAAAQQLILANEGRPQEHRTIAGEK